MTTAAPYRVLARKYRPQRFDQLIGQDAVVRTLANAIAGGRLAHAYLLTGVRGVGKTTTARLIAKALNCVGPGGTGGPTIAPCDVCEPCRAIAEGRFIDVLEMDAASNTGVDKMRELLDGVAYSAVAARFKIYVVDEVHMLSTSSFNALLKTLEEPPEHVKFIFATTEVAKLPVTILSRCQRFDLKRISAERLAAHYAGVAEAEGIAADPEALMLIARAAEGSARDGLSILDQAIAHGAGTVSVAAVQDMLGLADRGRVRALLGAVLAADADAVLAGMAALHDMGADPAAVLKDMLELVHATARVAAGAGADAGRAEEEQAAIAAWAARLGPGSLHRLWQLLLKGHAEVETAPLPQEAAEMALLRMVHAAGLPDPGELVRRLEGAQTTVGAPDARWADPARAPVALSVAVQRESEPEGKPEPSRETQPARAPAAVAPAAVAPASYEALVALFDANREAVLAHHLHDDVRPVRYAPPMLELAPTAALPRDFAQRVARCLESWTATRWTVALANAGGEPSMREREAATRAAVLAEPAVAALMAAFPGAELIDYAPPEAIREDKRA